MRLSVVLLTLAGLAIFGCNGQDAQQAATTEAPAHGDAQMPNDAVHGAMGDAQHDMGLNTEITLGNEIRNAWTGVVVEVGEPEGASTRYELTKGTATPLGDTGMVATLIEFLPDFEMGDTGITSRSNDPNNPAARLQIVEEGKPDYVGWLFADMPTIHPFPHETYSVVLVEGVPATSP